MPDCVACGRPVATSDSEPLLRAGAKTYHVACAPMSLVEQASEEYRAILRKGVRYFVEKYWDPAGGHEDLAGEFLALGRALERERDRRGTG